MALDLLIDRVEKDVTSKVVTLRVHACPSWHVGLESMCILVRLWYRNGKSKEQPFWMIGTMVRQRNESILIGASTTKSRDRVKAQAEVFTASDQVTAMLDLVRNCSDNIDSRFLEPSCGNGNFLVAILNRKMTVVAQRYRKQIDYEFYSLVALASIYGVEICSENVKEARERLKVLIKEWYSDKLNTKKPNDGFYSAVDYILKRNIILCDMLNDFGKIAVTEFSIPKPYKFKENIYCLADLMSAENDLVSAKRNPKPQSFGPIKNYLELANV